VDHPEPQRISSDQPPPQPKASQSELMLQIQNLQQQLNQASQERVQAQNALRLSNQRLRSIFEYSNDAIFVIDPKRDRILEANPKAAAMLGYSREELLESVRVSSIHPGEMEQLKAFGEQVLEQGHGWTNELTCLTKAGNQLPSEISSSVIPFEGEDCIISLVRDVTERKAAEDALRQSEDRFRTFVENAADAFFMIGPKGRIQDVNRRACESLGYTREELLQLSVPDINAELSPEELITLKQGLSFETPTVIETWHRRQDGSVFPAEVSICRFGSEDHPREIALARDITERKQAQAAMARLAEIGELSAMIVHEVRSPLTTVLMGLESFQGMELSERAQMRLGLALEEADRLKALLNEILQYAREQTLEVIDIDLVALVRKLQGAIADLPYAQDRVLTVDSTLPEAWIKGDTDKLKQVFINLIRNACEAVAAGDTITWRIDPAEQPHHVCVSVHNGGSPIPSKVLEKLGQPFFTTKSGGNGLGIAIIKRIVEAHQGDFSIESTAEKGTTVRVFLPLAHG